MLIEISFSNHKEIPKKDENILKKTSNREFINIYFIKTLF